MNEWTDAISFHPQNVLDWLQCKNCMAFVQIKLNIYIFFKKISIENYDLMLQILNPVLSIQEVKDLCGLIHKAEKQACPPGK